MWVCAGACVYMFVEGGWVDVIIHPGRKMLIPTKVPHYLPTPELRYMHLTYSSQLPSCVGIVISIIGKEAKAGGLISHISSSFSVPAGSWPPGRLEKTEDLWLKVRKDHAPRLARLRWKAVLYRMSYCIVSPYFFP